MEAQGYLYGKLYKQCQSKVLCIMVVKCSGTGSLQAEKSYFRPKVGQFIHQKGTYSCPFCLIKQTNVFKVNHYTSQFPGTNEATHLPPFFSPPFIELQLPRSFLHLYPPFCPPQCTLHAYSVWRSWNRTICSLSDSKFSF